MNLYHVQCEGEDTWVEAEDFGNAVDIWRASAIAEFGDEYLDAQPDSVARVHDGPVLRQPADIDHLATLRRAKAEGMRLAVQEQRCWEDVLRTEYRNVPTFEAWIDARAAQIEEGE